eukprot:gene2378-4621_t
MEIESTTNLRNIVVLGRLVVEKLKSIENTHIVCAVKDVSKARQLFGPESANLSVFPCNVCEDSPAKLLSLVTDADVVISCASYTPSGLPDPLGPFKVDFKGNARIMDACIDAKVPKFILVTSLLTNGLVAGQLFNPQFLLLNSFGGILQWKREAEKYLQSLPDIDYTIVRPGGLKDKNEDIPILFGAADTLFGGGISREQVAEVVVAAVTLPEASNKIIEIVASQSAQSVPISYGFRSVRTVSSALASNILQTTRIVPNLPSFSRPFSVHQLISLLTSSRLLTHRSSLAIIRLQQFCWVNFSRKDHEHILPSCIIRRTDSRTADRKLNIQKNLFQTQIALALSVVLSLMNTLLNFSGMPSMFMLADCRASIVRVILQVFWSIFDDYRNDFTNEWLLHFFFNMEDTKNKISTSQYSLRSFKNPLNRESVQSSETYSCRYHDTQFTLLTTILPLFQRSPRTLQPPLIHSRPNAPHSTHPQYLTSTTPPITHVVNSNFCCPKQPILCSRGSNFVDPHHHSHHKFSKPIQHCLTHPFFCENVG